jgi:hypothetical protein
VIEMTEKRFTSNNGVFYTDNYTGWEFQCYGEVVDLLNNLNDENEQLKEENENYKALLQDMGLLMSDNEVSNFRKEISDKLIKPLCKANGYDVDVDTNDGFQIIPKGDSE